MTIYRNGEDDGSRTRALFYEKMFEQSLDCLFFLRPDEEGRMVYEAINPTGRSHLPVDLRDAIGERPLHVLKGEAAPVVDDYLNTVFRTGEVHRYQPILQTPEGPVEFDAIYSPVRDRAGKPIGVLGSARDISVLRALEERVRHSGKVEAAGTISAGVAHDISNILMSISACLDLLERKADLSGAEDLITEARKEIDRGSAVAQRLLSFVRKRERKLARIDVARCVRELSASLARMVGDKIKVSIVAQGEVWIFADQHDFETALINLVRNSSDAMESGGAIEISISQEIGMLEGGAAQQCVTVSVRDTGHGMAPHLLEKVVDAYFTTKADGAGTGLGLSLVSEMMQSCGGRLHLASTAGVGTSAVMIFPIAAA